MNPVPSPVPATAPVVKTEASDLGAISLSSRISEFWTDHPRVWFHQTEATLFPQKMSDEAKYNIVVSKLGKSAIQQVLDILSRPPDTKKYETLKERLLKIYEESETRQIQKLIGEMELGDQRPSQLLRRMRELAREKISDETLRVLWQGHLPVSMRAIISVSETKDLDNLALVADKVMETTTFSQVAEVKTSASTSNNCSADTSMLLNEIAKLNRKIDNLERSRNRYRNNYYRPDNRNRSNSRSKSPQLNGNKLCFYHDKFKDKAHKCVKPCSWKANQEN